MIFEAWNPNWKYDTAAWNEKLQFEPRDLNLLKTDSLPTGILCFTWAYLIIYYEGKHPKAINAFFNIENMKEADGGYGGATEYSQGNGGHVVTATKLYC